MITAIRNFFKADVSDTRTDEFIWALAEALLWRDEEVSIGALPSPIKEQPHASRYYDDAKYLIRRVTNRFPEDEEE